MSRDDDEFGDVSRYQRREPTDRLNAGGSANEPINPQWRTSRTGNRPRAGQGLPSSSQEFALWLQYGGWRFLLAALVVVIIAAALIIFSQPGGSPEPLAQATDEPAVAPPIVLQTAQATVTPLPFSTPTASAPTAATGARFRVNGTGTEGLFLRPEPSTNGAPITTLPEGSEVEIIGLDEQSEGRTWKHIRAVDGTEGWAAADFLQPVQ
ncbi:MAG TPA: SH3 domain-containing protein [Roseiflexaceae bacterium]|nr:SH3 domain-containing protein [Roseiflexaceae bacterium]